MNANLEHPQAGVYIRGGSYYQGTTTTQIPELRQQYGVSFPGSFENEIPQYLVQLDSFFIDRYPVTNKRFAEFVGACPEWAPQNVSASMHNGRYLEHWTNGSYPEALQDHPVVFVTWQAALNFCRWAGGRLPSEAEWEFAACAGQDNEFPWGNELPSPKRANYGASDLGTTTQVGTYAANPFGLYDMAGNTWEWVLDKWEPTYADHPSANPIAGGDVSDDTILEIQGRRVIRGGSFAGAVVNLRTRWRDSHLVSNAVEFVGFRCVYPD